MGPANQFPSISTRSFTQGSSWVLLGQLHSSIHFLDSKIYYNFASLLTPFSFSWSLWIYTLKEKSINVISVEQYEGEMVTSVISLPLSPTSPKWTLEGHARLPYTSWISSSPAGLWWLRGLLFNYLTCGLW